MKKMRKGFLKFLFLMALLLPASLACNPAASETLAAGSSEKPEASEYTFTSIDGKAVSTKPSDGRTTVIIFGKPDCSNTQRTIRDIAQNNLTGKAGVRVIFAECSQASPDATRAFARTYGSSDITFCYDEDFYGPIFNAFNDYPPTSGMGALPFTVLIDGNNRLQNVLSGTQSTSTILSAIKKFTATGSNDDGSNKGENSSDPTDKEEGNTSPKVNVQIGGTENYDYANQVLALVNAERAKKGLSALQMDKALMETAMQRAAELSLYYDSSHMRPDGTKCFTASSRNAQMSAENIAMGQSSPQQVMQAWVSSAGHYANIVNKDLTSIGIGCFKDSAGVLSWVQFFDNAKASVPSLSGSEDVTRTVSILKSNLQLQPLKESTFTICTSKGKEVAMEILHKNKAWDYTMPKLSVLSFDFTSSDSAVTEVNNRGVITVQGVGTATITAALKSDKTCKVTKTVTVSDHQYISKTVAPTTKTEGYTLHTCSGCGDSYKDSFVPKLEDTTAPDDAQNPDAEQKPDDPQKPGNSGTEVSNVSGLQTTSGTTSVKLSWEAMSDADGYCIYQYQSSKKKWKKLAKVSAGQSSYTVKKLKSGTNYRFAVKAYKTINKKNVLSKSYASLYTATNPASVKLNGTAGKQKAVLKWNKVNGASNYTVYYKTKANDSWQKLKTTKNLTYTKKNLTSGNTYTFAVKANKVYKGSTYSGRLKEKKIKIK